MSLADISIKKPVFAWMINAFLVIFGLICLSKIGVSQMPDVDFPTVSISLRLDGASPEIIESDVIDPIEDALMSIQAIREINSTARHGSANITIEFDVGRDIDAAVQDIQTKLAQVQRLLPRDIDPPVVTKTNPEDNPIIWISISGHVPLSKLTEIARDYVKDRLQTVKGVGDITLGGYLDRNMRIWLKLEEMEARELTVDEVIAALQREHVELPAGRIETRDREMNVRSFGEAPSVEEFKKLIIAYRNKAPVYLHDIAVIEDGLADHRRLARAMGVPAIGLGVKKLPGSNAVEVARSVKARLVDISNEVSKMHGNVDVAVNFDSTRFIEESTSEMQFSLVLSVILTSLVCWLFLGSWSSTFNILLAIPTSIAGSFMIIYFMGFTLNTFTLLGLTLAVGIVVDDAIMVLENIVRHREKGEERIKAASRGAKEITMAAVAATMAIIAIFLPIAFMEGIIGKFLYQFGVTISIAVCLSLLEALTLTPMRCSQMLQVGADSNRRVGRMYSTLTSGYQNILAACLKRPVIVLAGSLALFVASVLLGSKLNQEIVPQQDQSRFVVRMQTPVGSSLEYTDRKIAECEKFMAGRPEVNRYFAIIGGFGGGEVDTGMMFVTLKPPAERGPKPITQHEFQAIVRARLNSIPGLRAFDSDLSMVGLVGRGGLYPIQFSITGHNWEELAKHAEEIMEKMKDSGLMFNVNSNYLLGMPEVKIIPDPQRAADLGVSKIAIGNTINALIGGIRVGKFTEGSRRYDVRVRLISEDRSRPEDVKRLFVRNKEGKLIRLSECVQVKEEPSLQAITRRDRARAITIQANVVAGKSQREAMHQVNEITSHVLPPGYRTEFTGTSRLFQQSGSAFVVAIGLGIIIAYMILASQFNSFIHPLHVLLAMPFSLSGAIIAMYLTGVSLTMFSMIGIVLLMGIVKKNSILLVEFTNQVRASGKTTREALMTACPIRLRPILMTSISTLAAALPPALALGPGAETRIPMAIVVIGGVLISTLMTLLVVPCAYSLVPGRVKTETVSGTETTPTSTL